MKRINNCPRCVWLMDDPVYGPVWYCRNAYYHDGYPRPYEPEDDTILIGVPPGHNGLASLPVVARSVASRHMSTVSGSNSMTYLNGVSRASEMGLICKREADRLTDLMRESWGLK